MPNDCYGCEDLTQPKEILWHKSCKPWAYTYLGGSAPPHGTRQGGGGLNAPKGLHGGVLREGFTTLNKQCVWWTES